MKYLQIIPLAALLISLSCNLSRKQPASAEKPTDTLKEEVAADSAAILAVPMHAIDLLYGFSVIATDRDYAEEVPVYHNFGLYRDQGLIWGDTAAWYEFGDSLWPMAIKTGDDSYQLIFEVCNRPSKNYLKSIRVEGYKVTAADLLPTFINEIPVDLNGDGIREYAGQPSLDERDSDSTAYNPILYYNSTSAGIVLDSTLTYRRNEAIYGTFYGYWSNEKYIFPRERVIPRLEAEIARVQAAGQ